MCAICWLMCWCTIRMVGYTLIRNSFDCIIINIVVVWSFPIYKAHINNMCLGVYLDYNRYHMCGSKYCVEADKCL